VRPLGIAEFFTGVAWIPFSDNHLIDVSSAPAALLDCKSPIGTGEEYDMTSSITSSFGSLFCAVKLLRPRIDGDCGGAGNRISGDDGGILIGGVVDEHVVVSAMNAPVCIDISSSFVDGVHDFRPPPRSVEDEITAHDAGDSKLAHSRTREHLNKRAVTCAALAVSSSISHSSFPSSCFCSGAKSPIERAATGAKHTAANFDKVATASWTKLHVSNSAP
jgi:hypothetical protein